MEDKLLSVFPDPFFPMNDTPTLLVDSCLEREENKKTDLGLKCQGMQRCSWSVKEPLVVVESALRSRDSAAPNKSNVNINNQHVGVALLRKIDALVSYGELCFPHHKDEAVLIHLQHSYYPSHLQRTA